MPRSKEPHLPPAPAAREPARLRTPTSDVLPRAVVRTLLLTDLVGSTALVEELGDEKAAEVISCHDRVARDLLAQTDGQEIDKSDGFLLLFARPLEAVTYALAFHRALAELSAELGLTLAARAGIHLGEVLVHDNDPGDVARGAKPLEVEGLAKPMVARLAGAAQAGQTLLTRGAFDLVRRAAAGGALGDEHLRFVEHGTYLFDGIREPERIFEIGVAGRSPLTPPPDGPKVRRCSDFSGALPRLDEITGSIRSMAAGGPRAGLRRHLLAASAFVLLAAGLWGFLAPRPATERPAMRRSVAVMGFKNLAQRTDAAWLSSGLSEMVRAELAAGDGLRLIAGENVERAKLELGLDEGATLAADTLARLRTNLGTDLVVMGSYLAMPEPTERLVLVLSVQDTASGETVATLREPGSQQRIFELVARLGDRLRRELGVDAAAGAAAARASLPQVAGALRPYAEGLRELRRHEYVVARRHLAEAIDAEPEHPLVRAAMAEVLAALGHDRQAAEESVRAVARAGRLPAEERRYVEARQHEIAKRWDEAAVAYRRLYDAYPDNVDYGLRLAHVLTMAGRGERALAAVGALRALPPPASGDPRLDLAEADAAGSLSDFERMLAASRRAAARAEGRGARLLHAEGQLLEGTALVRLGRLAEARAAVGAARTIYAAVGDVNGEARALNRLGSVTGREGRYDETLEIFEEVLLIMRRVGNHSGVATALNNVGAVRRWQGKLAAAEAALREALDLRRESGHLRLEGTVRSNLAEVLLDRGEVEEARRQAAESLRLARLSGSSLDADVASLALAEVELATGAVEEARGLLQAALPGVRARGDSHTTSPYLLLLGRTAQLADDLPAAQRHYDEALRLAESGADRPRIARCRLALAGLAADAGRLAAAGEELERVRNDLTEVDLPELHVRLHTAQLAVALARRHASAIADRRRQLASYLPRSEHRRAELEARIVLARAGGGDGGVKALAGVTAEAEELGFEVLALAARLERGRLERATGQAGDPAAFDRIAEDAGRLGLLRLARQATALAAGV